MVFQAGVEINQSLIRFIFSISSVVLRFSKMKTVTNLYILNLAFADEFFLIGLPILIYTMHLSEWIFGVYLCKLYMISTSITQFTSSIFLVIMSADRFDTLRALFMGDGKLNFV